MRLRPRLIIGCGVVLTAALAGVAVIGPLRERIPLFLVLYAVAFAAYLASIVLCENVKTVPRYLLWAIVVIAVLARAVLVPSRPSLSSDIYRYIWEGRVVNAGQNPFVLAPDAPELAPLRNDDIGEINHPHLATIYPPLAQGIFAVGTRIHASPVGMKVLLVSFDIATILVLLQLLPIVGVAAQAALVYAWNPLVIFETAHSGHVDAAGTFFLVLGLWFLLRRRNVQGMVAIAGAILVKYLPILLVPYAIARRDLRKWIPVGAAIVILGYVPFIGAGSKLFSSLQVYGAEWHFNNPLYELLIGMGIDGQMLRLGLAIAAALFVIVYAFRQEDLLRYSMHAIAAVLLLSPTVYPWYAIWIAPFLCVYRSRGWIAFTGLSFLSYTVWEVRAATGEWELPLWVLILEYAPVYALLVVDRVRSGGGERR